MVHDGKNAVIDLRGVVSEVIEKSAVLSHELGIGKLPNMFCHIEGRSIILFASFYLLQLHQKDMI